MPLQILLILVVGGIGAVAVLLHLTGRSRQTYLDEGKARAAWIRQFPEQPAARVLVAQNGKAALVAPEAGQPPLGLVWSFGADTVARDLQHLHLSQTARGLRLQFSDFGAPQADLRLSPAEIEQWHRIIAAQSFDAASGEQSNTAGRPS